MDSQTPPLPPEGPDAGNATPSPVPQVPALPAGGISSEERNMALFCHLGSLSGYFFPMGNILLPLLLWQLNKDKMPFVNDQGKESVNFQISILIYALVSFVSGFVTCGIGFFVSIGVAIFSLVMVIIAGLDANNGIPYRYPLCIRMIT